MRKFFSGKKDKEGTVVFLSFLKGGCHFLCKNLQVLLLFLVVGTILYGQILHAPFFFDDHKMILENWTIRDIRHIDNIWRVVDYPRLCFFTFVTFALNYHFGAYDPFGYHGVNILLHVCTAFLFQRFILILLTLPSGIPEDLKAQKFSFSLVAALVFLVHPIQTQAVSWVWSRTEILSAFLGFLSLLLYLNGRMKKRLVYFLFAAVAFFAGIFSRGNILILPVLVFLIEISFFGLTLNKMKHSLKRGWPLCFVLCLFLLWLTRYIPAVIDFLRLDSVVPESFTSMKIYLLTQFSVVVRYMQLLFFPFNQNIDHYILPSEFFREPRILLSFMIIVSVLVTAFFLFKRQRFMGFGIFWFFICLIPVSTIIILSTTISESRLYFPSAGFAIFITAVLYTFIPSIKARRAAAMILIIVLSSLTIMRNTLWRSPISLTEDAVKKSPLHPRPHLVLGTLYDLEGRFEEAAQMFQTAINLKPDYLDPYNNLAVIYMHRGEWQKAKELLSNIILFDQGHAQAYLNLGYIAIQQQDWWLAKEIFVNCIKYCGPRPEAYIGLADCYMLRRYVNEELMDNGAMANLKKALELDPRNRQALFRFGQIYATRKEFDKALAVFQDIIKLNPRDVEVLVQTGRIYMSMNQWEQARQILLKAMAMDPQNPQVYELLGQIYFAMKDFHKAEEYYQEAARMFSELNNNMNKR